MAVPVQVLQALQAMDGYEQMLAMDKIAREHGVSAEQLSAELQAFVQSSNPTAPIQAPSHKIDAFTEASQPQPSTPRYIDDPSKLRMRYDPSVEGTQKQAGITQAILCPSCSAPLGIPSVRPIRVTCPNCAVESLFEN